MIELVRYLYTQFHLWAFVLSAFAFIALWFTQPRLALKEEMQERVAQIYIKKYRNLYSGIFYSTLISCSKSLFLRVNNSGKVSNSKLICFNTSV